jgi:hypothetical protein
MEDFKHKGPEHTEKFKAGRHRTYFFDVYSTRKGEYYLTVTESKKRADGKGYERHKIFLYKEDFNKFLKAITEAVDHVKTELMPDFDFDAFNHENDGEYDGENNYTPASPTESPIEATASSAVIAESKVEEPEHDIEPSTITEKKPLEARDTHASQGDNLSNEEVDKW